ncbi:hypothetical protein BRYFOR_08892 [Marvinbryantia formatexigens DSM 14469]|uniref:Uncharacterized protein n=1 Tax=Marvinbryantia formatexigens DSM 14469 TaxID=478749 RepID=C6LJQ5_9FIRM|nr:hypothetical protein BRYFOR_08892 [Marvinbryantia formatexigens DSM 14469]
MLLLHLLTATNPYRIQFNILCARPEQKKKKSYTMDEGQIVTVQLSCPVTCKNPFKIASRWDFCTLVSFSYGLCSECKDLSELLRQITRIEQKFEKCTVLFPACLLYYAQSYFWRTMRWSR